MGRNAILLALAAAIVPVLAGAGRAGATSRSLDVLAPGLVAEVERDAGLMRLIGADRWERVVKVSDAVAREGLTAASEGFYLPFEAQRSLILDLQEAKGVREDVRLALLDVLVQYYVFTYYYDGGHPRERSLRGEHGAFLAGLGAEFAWVEPAAQSYYKHTFLRRLVATLPDSEWGRYYRSIGEATGFDDIPAEREGESPGDADGGRSEAVLEGDVDRGRAFSKPFGPGFVFELRPGSEGWLVVVRCEDRDEDLSRLTPPFHFAPNPRELEGWHFRNADNTGPNEAGDKNVNAPGKEREFIFSPEVGRSIDPGDKGAGPTEEDVAAVRAYGRGLLTVLGFRLGNLEPNARARFDRLRFRVRLDWPADSPGCR